MKTIHKIHAVCLLFVLAVGMSIPNTVHAQPGVSISRQDFYNELSPYGQWMNNPSYGQVWRPNVGSDFQPYATDGHWEMTEYGNTWVSDYDWGWAPFHYGRWLFDDYYGWIWVPGDEWGPAWVTWRSGGGYYGWAPLGPGMGIDVNININIPYNYWVFVPDIYIQSPRVYSYCVPRNRIGNIFGGTVYINNYYRYNNRLYAYGPQRHDIERITRNRINVYRADDIYRQGRYARNNGGSRPYDSRPNYNGNGRNWDNNGRQNQSPRYDNDNRISRNDRFDNNNQGQNRYDQRQNSPQQPRQDDRPYTAPERGNAQRTWSDNGGYNQQPRANREQAPQRSYESRENLPQRRNNDYEQPRSSERNERNGGSYQQQPQSRGGRESAQPRGQEQGQRGSSEHSGEGHRGGRRGN